MPTYDFVIRTSGNVRIDAESEEEATQEFLTTFAQEAVLVTARQDQILVLDGIAWENPTVYVDPDEGEEKEENGQDD